MVILQEIDELVSAYLFIGCNLMFQFIDQSAHGDQFVDIHNFYNFDVQISFFLALQVDFLRKN